MHLCSMSSHMKKSNKQYHKLVNFYFPNEQLSTSLVTGYWLLSPLLSMYIVMQHDSNRENEQDFWGLVQCYQNMWIHCKKNPLPPLDFNSTLELYTYIPDLNVHEVYSQTDPIFPECHRIAFSKLHLVSHNLRNETGRWARLPREQRLCQCRSVQTEDHIIADCALSRTIRDRNPHMVFTLPEFFWDNSNHDVCKVVYDLLNLYMNDVFLLLYRQMCHFELYILDVTRQ